MPSSTHSLSIGIAWCLAWGDTLEPHHPQVIEQMRQALQSDRPLPDAAQPFLQQAQQLDELEFPETRDALAALAQQHPDLWTAKIGLVYGGATKIKQYVFEAAKLPDIRGASALLDRINLFDIPAFFGREKSVSVEQWLDQPDFRGLRSALMPNLIVYSTGGNILAFCPVAYMDTLADAIEKRYTHETLTANSCAVGASFRVLEVKFGRLQDPITQTFWLDQYRANHDNDLVRAYFDQEGVTDLEEKFCDRKNFTELITQLTGQYNQRRSGFDLPGSDRPSRRYPPMFETQPYLRRDQSDRRSAIAQVNEMGDRPWLSETLVRKRIVGQIAKRQVYQDRLPPWFRNLNLEWQPIPCRVTSWVAAFEKFLDHHPTFKSNYYTSHSTAQEAQTLRDIGNISSPQGFVAYIYADGNNMGGYIQKEIHTPEHHQQFSGNISNAVQQSVYQALANHLSPRKLKGLSDPDNQSRNNEWIHPFEIIAIGGDDVLLIVPADQALSIAKTIGEAFEADLARIQSKDGKFVYRTDSTYNPKIAHRYQSPITSENPTGENQCKLSVSIGVLITSEATPIYYAQKLVEQLLKSAKRRAKELKQHHYSGGTIDFLTLKSVTMLSDKIETFRQEGLTKEITIQHCTQTLKQYAAPYTLHEIGGLINTVRALKQSSFPRSQLYQIRSLLAQGKHTAILNYRYFRVRLKSDNQRILQYWFEDPWCAAKTNNGNLAPWISFTPAQGSTGYETIWRDLVDLYDFIEASEEGDRSCNQPVSSVEVPS